MVKKFVFAGLLIANLSTFFNGVLHVATLTHIKDSDEHLHGEPKGSRKRKKKQEWHIID